MLRRSGVIRTTASALLALVLFLGSLSAQTTQQPTSTAVKAANGKKPLTLADYGRWNRIQSTALSDDGKWFAYAYTPNDGDGTLYVRLIDGDKVHSFPRGTGAVFSDDSKWVAFFVTPPRSGRGGGGRRGGGPGPGNAQEPAPNRALFLLNL
ncbi:MAG TPA: hypothetical protein VK864_11015, partial [Longimicrobiales bacterium]|nr:hypothetical protein [Longimicrobiales bacterium]